MEDSHEKLLVVIDYQNDFVNVGLEFQEAVKPWKTICRSYQGIP